MYWLEKTSSATETYTVMNRSFHSGLQTKKLIKVLKWRINWWHNLMTTCFKVMWINISRFIEMHNVKEIQNGNKRLIKSLNTQQKNGNHWQIPNMVQAFLFCTSFDWLELYFTIYSPLRSDYELNVVLLTNIDRRRTVALGATIMMCMFIMYAVDLLFERNQRKEL